MSQQTQQGQSQTQQQVSNTFGGFQGVIQISVLGQLPSHLLEQVHRRLRNHAEHEADFVLHEDVLFRGHQEPGTALREEDTIRVRGMTVDGETEWSLVSLSRPAPVRENHDVLMRSIAFSPVLEGDAGSLAVALGYAERKFAFTRRGHLFSLSGGLTMIQIYQVYTSSDPASAPLDPTHYILEVISYTALKPSQGSQVGSMQQQRDNAIERTMEVKRVLKGLVDLERVE